MSVRAVALAIRAKGSDFSTQSIQELVPAGSNCQLLAFGLPTLRDTGYGEF
ncbi:MAG: hypothetical protein M1587_02075 [Thaumarchaeota archaeon]|nr:hypothetical protein [Nitrososphaerota archaeon]